MTSDLVKSYIKIIFPGPQSTYILEFGFENPPKFSASLNMLYLLFFQRQLENIQSSFPPSDLFQANKLVLHGHQFLQDWKTNKEKRMILIKMIIYLFSLLIQ